MKMAARLCKLFVLSALCLVAGVLPGCAQWHVAVDRLGDRSNVRLSTDNHEETEPSIAVDPTDQNRVVTAILNRGQRLAGGGFINTGCRYSYSVDGGVNWTNRLIRSDDYNRTQFSDPSIAMDRQGNAYIAGFFHNFDATGNFSDIQPIIVRLRKADIDHPQVVLFNDGSNRLFDKPHLTIDSDGRLWILYTAVNPSALQDREIRAITIDQVANIFDGPTNQPLTLPAVTLAEGNNWGVNAVAVANDEIHAAWTNFVPTAAADVFSARIMLTKYTQRNGWAVPQMLAELGAGTSVNGFARSTRYPVMAVSPEQLTSGWLYTVFADSPPLYLAITMPDADRVNVNRINERGTIVGWYRKTSEPTQIFSFRREVTGGYDIIAYPGAKQTIAQAVNNNGIVVGTFEEDSGVSRGFMWSKPNFSLIYYPMSLATHAMGINSAGDVVGWYTRQDQVGHGFIRHVDGSYVTFDYPDAVHTFPSAINSSGSIVGRYVGHDNVNHGFIYSNGQWQTVDVSQAKATSLRDINELGELLGTYTDAGDHSHGFLQIGNARTVIDYPSSADVYLTGLNKIHQITGYYLHDNDAQPFVIIGFGGEVSQDIWVTRSVNDGETWRLPVRVNDVSRGDQLFPWLCADKNGTVFVSWLDRRDDPVNLEYHVYASATRLGSMSFLDNVEVTTIGSNPHDAAIKVGDAGFVGDYTGLACGNDVAYVAWPDLRHPPQDIFGARIRAVDP